MEVDERLNLISEVGEEIISEEELKTLLETKKHPIAYDGFEPSGNVHIAQGVMRAININKLTKSGVKFKMFVADWHAWANNKMGGDLEKIQTVGNYLIEVWRSTGMDLDNVKFVWASELVKDEAYWGKVMKVSINSTVKRILRCSQIMGRTEQETQQASQILYPCMQCADIFHLEADICQLGMDQRKVNMLAREIGEKLGYWKPVIVSHHMLMGLGQPPATDLTGAERGIEMKMSKSKPETAIFMTDSTEDIKRKITNAYCPAKQITDNPILEYSKYILFEKFDEIKVERPSKFGGDVSFKSYNELQKAYMMGELHPLDLKKTVGVYVDKLIGPVRSHFEKNQKAKNLLEQVKSFQ
ncbi:tyrosine--tRNA ligase, partial [Candidatus Woesearchaeota archaeon]|nr:tyrosine--tRNA ligase [Candidatus Woesearchaeota archaeon]